MCWRNNLSLVALKIWVSNLHGYFFDRPLGFYQRFCPTYQKIEINVVAAIIVFFSLQPTCFDLSYLECLSISDSHKAVEKRPTLLITFCSGFKGSQLDSLLVQKVCPILLT